MMLMRAFHHKRTQPRSKLPVAFLALLASFAVLTRFNLALGLAGIGSICLVGALLVEAGSSRIWDDYRKAYRKQRRFSGVWHEPKALYYQLNVYVLWPFVALLGAVSLYLSVRVG